MPKQFKFHFAVSARCSACGTLEQHKVTDDNVNRPREAHDLLRKLMHDARMDMAGKGWRFVDGVWHCPDHAEFSEDDLGHD